MSKKPVIAIDGLAATGKGTLARNLADKLGFAHLDTGTLYRATALAVLSKDGDPADESIAIVAAKNLAIRIKEDISILNSPDLREPEVSNAAALTSQIQGVRDALFDLQQDFAANPGKAYKGAVLDGRDIGTVVCPNADIKFFVVASAEVRAKRRHKELQLVDKSVTYAHVLAEMNKRDEWDTTRKTAPTKQAEDAILLDTSELNAAQVLEMALEIIRSKFHQ